MKTVVDGEQGRLGGQTPARCSGPEHDDEFGGPDLVVDQQGGQAYRTGVTIQIVDSEADSVESTADLAAVAEDRARVFFSFPVGRR